ncbi:MAG: hypothetical protein GY719_25740 [bacterium]|nr:hypothetical protein [bacterium]
MTAEERRSARLYARLALDEIEWRTREEICSASSATERTTLAGLLSLVDSGQAETRWAREEICYRLAEGRIDSAGGSESAAGGADPSTKTEHHNRPPCR